MYYPDEIRQAEKVDGRGRLSKAEVEMASSLVENLSASFVREMRRRLQRAAQPDSGEGQGKKLPEPEADEDEGEVIDLMAALRESVEQTQKQKKSTRGKKAARKAS